MQIFSLSPGLAVTMNERYLVFRSRLVDRRLHFTDELGEPVLMKEKDFYAGRRQKLSATPDLSGRVLPCLITNSALKNAPISRSV
ncbi:MAG: hypothetical protein ACRESN_02035, partial [Pseudomonas sp.]